MEEGYLQSFYKDSLVNLMAFFSHKKESPPAPEFEHGWFQDHIFGRDGISVQAYRCDVGHCPARMCMVEISVKPRDVLMEPTATIASASHSQVSLQSPQSPRTERHKEELEFETIEDDEEDLDEDDDEEERVRCMLREIFETSEPLDPLHRKTLVFNSWATSIFLRPVGCNPPLPTEDIITDPFSGYGLWRTVDTDRQPICANDVFKIVQLFYFNDHPHGNRGSSYMDLSFGNCGYVCDEASSLRHDCGPNEPLGAAEQGTTLYAMDPFDNYRCWNMLGLNKFGSDWLNYFNKPTTKIRKKLQIFYLGDDATEVDHLSEEEANSDVCFGDDAVGAAIQLAFDKRWRMVTSEYCKEVVD